MWRSVLSPGWVFTVLIALAFAYLAFTVLAPWQLDKGDAVHARNERVRAAETMDPVALSELYTVGTPLAEGNEYRQVEVQGTFTDHVVVLRNRPVGGVPAYQVLGVVETADGNHYLVHRGWEPVADARTLDRPEVPTGEVSFTARLRQDEPLQEGAPQPFEDGDMWQVYGINTELISELVGVPLEPMFLQLMPDAPGLVGQAFPLPELDDGPHLSYGIQWIGFGLVVPIGVGYFIYNEIRERRRDAELDGAPLESERVAGAGPLPEDDTPAHPSTADEAPVSAPEPEESDAEREAAAAARRAAKMAQRYGRR